MKASKSLSWMQISIREGNAVVTLDWHLEQVRMGTDPHGLYFLDTLLAVYALKENGLFGT